MTNAEKYKKQIDKIKRPNESPENVLTYNLTTNKLTKCNPSLCNGCLFFFRNYKNGAVDCTENCKDWLQSEYEEHAEKDTISEEPNKSEYIGVAQKVKQLLFVEDGSADMFNLYSQLRGNPEIAIIVYRKGSKMPILVNLEDEK